MKVNEINIYRGVQSSGIKRYKRSKKGESLLKIWRVEGRFYFLITIVFIVSSFYSKGV